MGRFAAAGAMQSVTSWPSVTGLHRVASGQNVTCLRGSWPICGLLRHAVGDQLAELCAPMLGVRPAVAPRHTGRIDLKLLRRRKESDSAP